MYCVHCGEKLIKGSAFCNHCGGKVGDTSSSSQPSIKTTGMFSPVATDSGDITMDVNDVKIDNSKKINNSKTDINAEVIAHVERDMIIDKRNIDKRKNS